MNPDPVKILITGDFCPINRIENLAIKQDYKSVFNDFLDVFLENDLNITDLECSLTESESARVKSGPHQKAHPECIKILKHANINLVAMANNHVMDYNNKGVLDTLELCSKNGIQTVGIGGSREDAASPFSTIIRHKRLSILNFADNEFLSTPNGEHHSNPIDPIKCYSDVVLSRQSADYLIVILHAGNEFFDLPSPRTKALYRFFIDIGADAVISHHTHAYSGYEIYKSKPIFYGLGNFLYDWPGKVNTQWNLGFVVRLQFSESTDFEIIPLKQCNEKPGVFHLNSLEKELFEKKIQRLNHIISDDQQLEEEFQKYCKSVFSMYDAFIEPNFGKYITALRNRGFFPKLMTKRKRILLLNLIRCESHRDVLLRLLKRYE